MKHDNAFSDIKIVEADQELTNVPDAARPAMYDVYLRLSDTPPDAWAESFEQAWQSHIYMKKRRARLDGHHLVIQCPLDELEKYHKPELLAVFAQVNEQYTRDVAQHAVRQRQAAEREALAIQEKKNRLGGLKFD